MENRTAEEFHLGSRTGACMVVPYKRVGNRDRKGRSWEGIVAQKDELPAERLLLWSSDLADTILMT